jgi:Ca-activated chloride channel family protein
LEGRSNDLVGLGTFAGFLEENVPLTLDHFTLIDFLKDVKLAQRYEDGTFIGDAVYQSVLRLISIDQFLSNGDQDYKIKSKIIVLLTDGQHTKGSFPPLDAAKFAQDNNIKIYTIAIQGQEAIQGSRALLFPVLDTSILEDMAKITGGIFSKASSGESLKAIYEKIDKLEKSKISDSTLVKKEWFPLFLKISIFLFLLHLFLKYFVIRKVP